MRVSSSIAETAWLRQQIVGCNAFRHSTPPGHRVQCCIPDYRRNRFAGGTYFFTVNLLDRDRPLLVEHIGLLRESVRRVGETGPEFEA
jgi:hypothetical protein